jgi:uncharacterized coiled-coil DUF342 family protein
MSKRDEYVQEAKSELDAMSAKLDQLESEGQEKSDQAHASAKRWADDLRARRDETAKQLQALRASGESAFDHMQTGVRSAMRDLGEAFD